MNTHKHPDSELLDRLRAGLLDDEQGSLAVWLRRKGIDVARLKAAAEATVMPLQTESPADEPPRPHTSLAPPEPESALTRYGTDLTRLARLGRLKPPPAFDPTIERDAQQTIQILSRRKTNNPLLLTEDPTRARQVVETVAQRLTLDTAPPALAEHHLVELNLSALSGDISYQGEFAARIRQVIDVASNQSRIILFINGIETIIGSGMIHVDMSDIITRLKDALLQGDLQCIGATTPYEYHNYIARKYDLQPFFQPLVCGKPAEKTAPAEAPPPEPPLPPPPVGVSEPLQWFEGISMNAERDVIQEELQGLEARLSRLGIVLRVSDSAMQLLSRLSGPGQPDVSILRNLIEQKIENRLGLMLVRGEVSVGQTVAVNTAGDDFILQVV